MIRLGNRRILLIVAVFFILGILSWNLINSPRSSQKTDVDNKTQTSPSLSPCSDPSYSETAKQLELDITNKLSNTESAIKLARKDCIWIFGGLKGKLNDSGEENIIFWGGHAGCASCHDQTIYVLSNDKVIFKRESDDPRVGITKDSTGKDTLSIYEPVRKDGEPLCCPSEGIRTLYHWNNQTNEFIPTETSSYKYERGS